MSRAERGFRVEDDRIRIQLLSQKTRIRILPDNITDPKVFHDKIVERIY